MPAFSTKSQMELNTCDTRLIRLFQEVVISYDCVVIDGQRTNEEQEKNLLKGVSQTKNSKHLNHPSLAVDVAPYPIDWKNTKRFYHFAGFVQAIALRLGINIRWGGDWDRDKDLDDQTLYDLVHFEIVD